VPATIAESRVTIDNGVPVPMSDGTLLAADVFRPAARGRYR
jgi:predicted acyl esterase